MKDKPKSMTPKTQKRSVVFSTETLEQIEKLAIKKNVFASDIIREFLDNDLLDILCYSCFGIPRALINMIRNVFSIEEECQKFNKSNYTITNVKKAVKESFIRTENVFRE